MYLNLLHNGKKYFFETNNKLNVGHLKELSGKILNLDKNFLHIMQNNNKYAFPNNTFLKDLIPQGKKRAVFSIKADEKNITYNEDRLNDNDIKIPNKNRKSFEELINSNKIKKNIINKYSHIWNIQSKFLNTITYKYNEFLIEIREFNKRINEIYDKLYQNYIQSYMNHKINSENLINKKLTKISLFQYQMIKFIDNEKKYYQKLNNLIKNCISINNNKITILNRDLKELYIGMINANLRNSDYNTNSNRFFNYFKQNNTILGNMRSIFGKNNNKFIFDNSSLKKTITKDKKRMSPCLSFDNIKRNNKIISSQDEKMIISTELGSDGVQRGKIIIFDNEEDKKKSLFDLKLKGKNEDNEKNEKNGDKIIEKIPKNTLKSRNFNLENNFNHSIIKDETIENKKMILNLSEGFMDKEKLNDKMKNKNNKNGLINNRIENNSENKNNKTNNKRDNNENIIENKIINDNANDNNINIENKKNIHSLFYKNIRDNINEEDSSNEDYYQKKIEKKKKKKA